jgi:saccharopine dehydrogenase-like NADP-dependent oxidoreductase
MKKKISILGGGLAGSAIAVELNKQYEVKVIDLEESVLAHLKRCFGIEGYQADALDRKKLEQFIADSDLVIGTLPGAIGFEVMRRVIDAGKNIVDISFFPENAFELDERAKHKKVCAVVDAGAAPGISNLMLGYHYHAMKVTNYECYTGGLPIERQWPWQYKAVFSTADVIQEYIRPARLIENGQRVTKEALSDPEIVFIEGIGSLEAWNSDGLRTLLTTVNIPNMFERTLRYPGTIEYLKVLRDSGFFSETEIELNDNRVRPIDFTTKVLEPLWQLKKTDEDFIYLKVRILGQLEKRPVGYEYQLFDRYDTKLGSSAMARTTGFTCCAISNLLLDGTINQYGIIAPEQIAFIPGTFTRIMNTLEHHGIQVKMNQLY